MTLSLLSRLSLKYELLKSLGLNTNWNKLDSFRGTPKSVFNIKFYVKQNCWKPLLSKGKIKVIELGEDQIERLIKEARS